MTMQVTERFDIVGKTKIWLGAAIAVMLLGLMGLFVRGFNLGLDFTGGALYQFKFPEKVATTPREEVQIASEVRSMLGRLNLPSQPVIQIAEGDTLLIRLKIQSERESERWRAEILQALRQKYPKIEEAGTEFIGSVVGSELTRSAILATIFGLVLVSLFIWFRYQILGAGWLFSLGALFALAHDVLVLVGFTAWSQIEVNSSFIAALLTVAGYSVQDTVVIYDRIRENLKVRRGWAFERIVNYSLLETMSRSINTSLTTAFALWAILLVGGVAVKPLAFSLFIGITAGTYSSIFIAAPLVLLMQRWWEAKAALKRPAAAPVRRPVPEQRPILRVTTPTAEAEAGEVAEKPASSPTGSILRPSATTPSPRKPRRKRRR
ncbi:MAG: protein translocase subunit SecF [Armatimonadetes bacterium]|nr:protein translocase subunit SecF [Armatimonadota bacterium]